MTAASITTARSGATAAMFDIATPHRPAEIRGHGGRGRTRPPTPVPQSARDLLADAQRTLDRSMSGGSSAERYSAAHLAALRAAAAVLATRARPGRARRASAWDLMSKVAPEFGEWAAYFAAGSTKRQAADAGITRLITTRDADDMVRQSAAFLDLVRADLA